MGNLLTSIVTYLPFLRLLQEKCRKQAAMSSETEAEPLIENRDDRQDQVVEHDSTNCADLDMGSGPAPVVDVVVDEQPQVQQKEQKEEREPESELAAAERMLNFKEPDSINDQNEISELDNTLDLLTRGTESRAATDFIDIDEDNKNSNGQFEEHLEYNSEIDDHDDHNLHPNDLIDVAESNTMQLLEEDVGPVGSVPTEPIFNEDIEIEADQEEENLDKFNETENLILNFDSQKSEKDTTCSTDYEKLSMAVNLSIENSPSKSNNAFAEIEKEQVHLGEEDEEPAASQTSLNQTNSSTTSRSNNDSGLSNEVSESNEKEAAAIDEEPEIVGEMIQENETEPEPENTSELEPVGEIYVIDKMGERLSISNRDRVPSVTFLDQPPELFPRDVNEVGEILCKNAVEEAMALVREENC